MEFRQLGESGLEVPALSFGTASFGGQGAFFRAWGDTDRSAARNLVDICIEHGINMFDSADIYSSGLAEEILGAAVSCRRGDVIISTKGNLRTGPGVYDVGSSRRHLTKAINDSLQRLGTDYIDIYHLHSFDALVPIEETLETLNEFIRAGKIRCIGASNYSGWHLSKTLAIAERHNLPKIAAHQVFYSLVGRDYESELMPLALDMRIPAIVWSPLGWGRLTGKIERNHSPTPGSRLKETGDFGPPVSEDLLFQVIGELESISVETGKTIPQIAINWLLQRPSVASIIIGARNETQLVENLGAVGWSLTESQIGRLNMASEKPIAYPYWHQRCTSAERNPPPV